MDNVYKSFFKTVGGGEGDKCYYPTRLDTYGKGCFYDCKYCYNKQLLDFRGLWHPDDVSVAPLRDVVQMVSRKLREGDVVRLGGMTDCLQPIEGIYRNTYKTIRYLNRRKVHYLIVTKSNLLLHEDYIDVMDKKYAHIQVSVPSTDDEVLNATDNAPSFEVRKEVIEKLYDNGFDVSLRLSPFLFDTCDYDLINEINVDKCLVEFLRIKPSMFKLMEGYINPDDYKYNDGSYRHLSLDKKLYELAQLDFKELTVCDDVQGHYDYFKENFNYNADDCCNLSL